MASSWTTEQVLSLAPDEGSAKAGRSLAAPGKWVSLGRDERALWGECSGSGTKPYQVEIDLSEPAFKCTCPSHKFPCKHALGLFLLFAAGSDAMKEGTAPAWVEEWLNRREARVKAKGAAAAEPARPKREAGDAAQ